MTDPLGVASHAIDGGRVVALSGELDASTARGLAEQLFGEPGSLVVVDLSRLTFIDSSGLGAIHAARRRMTESGGTLVLCRPNPMVSLVLEVTGLDQWVVHWEPRWSNGSPLGTTP
jgi:anti-anti-sigma factor